MLTGCVNFQHLTAGAVELSAEELQAAAAEAHRLNLPVSIHANGSEGVAAALAAGVQTIEHGALLDEAAAALITTSPVYWTPTISPFFQMLAYSRQHSCPALPPTGVEQVYTRHCSMVKQAIAAGARIIAGTDAGAQGVDHGEVWQELALLVSLGMQPERAIAAATGVAAEALGIADKTGLINAGKIADLLVVAASPLEDMQNLRKILQVYKDGLPVLPHQSRISPYLPV